MNTSSVSIRRLCYLVSVMAGMLFLPQSPAYAALSITPNSWNIIGMDSNLPSTGPKYFPVMAKVCSNAATTNVTVTLNWDSSNSYINVRTGTNSSYAIPSIGAGACKDAYFEAEVDTLGCTSPTCASFDTTRRYHISAQDGSGTVNTTTPRELYVEHLISQSRNSVTSVKYWPYSLGANPAESAKITIPVGGTGNVSVGSQYYFEVTGATATNGYNQYTQYLNLPNHHFRVESVSSTYNVRSNTDVTNPHASIYADACHWSNDPNSPTYRSCIGTNIPGTCDSSNDYCSNGKAGGDPNKTLYEVTVVGGAGSSDTVYTLLYDFSGSSYHYNADVSSTRIITIGTTASIDKSFSASSIAPGGTSTLTFTLNNTGTVGLSNANFKDNLPTGMTVAATTNVGGTCISTYGGTLQGSTADSGYGTVAGGNTWLYLSGATIPAGSNCTVTVNVTATTDGTYPNISQNLFVNTSVDTGDNASATLIVSSTPPGPSTCTNPVTLATWTMPASGQGSGGPPPAYATKETDVSSATAGFVAGPGTPTQSIVAGSTTNAWRITGGFYVTPTGATPSTPPGANTSESYFDFTLDTSKYGGVQISFSADAEGPGDWGNPSDNWIYIYSKDDSNSFSSGNSTSITKGAWRTGFAYTAATTGTGTTTFRIGATGTSSGKQASASMSLDDITITGCVRPTLPTLAKSFTSSTIAKGTTTGLTFTVTNPNTDTNSGYNYTGIRFTDTLPSGLTLNSATPSSNTCGFTVALDTANGIINLTNGSLAANATGTASCSITFPATTVTGTVEGTHTNTTSQVLTNQTEPGNAATANLTVLEPPVLSKNFAPAYTTGSSTMTLTIQNPDSSQTLTGLAFTDNSGTGWPADITIATPNGLSNGCGGTVTAAAGTQSVSASGISLAAGASCTISLNVTVSGTVGTKTNTTSTVTATGPVALTGNSASASLYYQAPSPSIDLTKQVSTNAAGPWYNYVTATAGNPVYYRFKVYNSGDVSLSGVNINETQNAVSPTCSGSSLAADAELYCTASVTAAAGTTTNIATARGTYISTNDTVSDPSSATYSTTGLWLTKSADPATFASSGDVITYTYVVTNNGSAALAGPVTIADNKTSTLVSPDTAACPSLTTVGNGDNFLNPGESITCRLQYTIVYNDTFYGYVTNVATASAGGVSSNTATKTVYYDPPTYVLVSNFHAGVQDGQAVLEWGTEREQGTLGFYIERQDIKTGKWQRLNNEQMLPGLIAAPQGGDYRFVDPDAIIGQTYNYRLIEHEMWGADREYGPWSVTFTERSDVQASAAASRDTHHAGFWRSLGQGYSAHARHIPAPKRAAAPAAQNQSVAQAAGQASKLRFRTGADGLYRIGPARLADAANMLGITTAELIKNLKGGNMQLKNGSTVMPYHYNPDDKSLYFIGNAYQTRETEENVYRLSAGAGSVMQQVSGAAPLPVAPGIFRDTQHFEENKPGMLLPWIHKDENADYWYWDYVYPPYTPSAMLTFRLPNPAATGQGVLKIFLRGGTNEATGNDREATATLNGTLLPGSVKWNGNRPAVLQATFSQEALTFNADGSASMRLKINGTLGKGASFDLFLIDRVEVEYNRKMRAHQGGIWLHNLAKGIKAADGFASQQIKVIENPGTEQAKWRKDVIISPAADGSWQISFKTAGGMDYLAVETPRSTQPEADLPSKLKSPQHNAGYLIIAPRELTQGAAALANYRNQEFGTEIVWLQDIYDEFSFGRTSSKAVDAFLDYVHAKWKRVPSYIVLLGRGTFDHRNLLGYNESLVPMRLTATPWGLSGSDNRYADVDGDHLPDYSLGRIAVSNDTDAIAYVDKLAAYEAGLPGAWSSHAALVADNPDRSGNFRSDSNHIGDLLHNYTVTKLYHPLVDVRKKLLSGWNNGYGYVNYIGHGASTQLASEGFLTAADVIPETLHNGKKLPIFAALSCAVGDSTMPGVLGLSDKLVLLPGGGAIAAFSALGLSLNSDVAPLNVNFVESLLVNRESIGSAAVTAHDKAAAQSKINLFMHDIYQVSGDPAVTLH